MATSLRKPECEACKEAEARAQARSGGLNETFGREFTEELIYGMFNPEDMQENDQGSLDLERMIGSYMNELSKEDVEGYMQSLMDDSRGSWLYGDWLEGYAKGEMAREKAWQQLLEKIRSGKIRPSNISAKDILKNFNRKLMESLAKDGLIELKLQKHHLYPKVYTEQAEFTLESERIIAKKVLEEAFRNLEKQGFGLHEIRESGLGTYPSSILTHYDEMQHAFDMLDIQETMVSTAIHDPQQMEITDTDLKARIPLSKVKSSNIILMDISYSMHGNKFRGGMMAALALRQLLEEEFKEDSLHLIAYNDETYLVPPGHVLRLRPHGNTDIGRSLDLSIQILSKEEGNKNIFLITDSEPTASYNYDQTPEENMFRAAYLSGREDIAIHIVMLDRKPELRRICETAARLNGNSTVTYVDNPLNLKEFIIRTYVNYKKARGRSPA